MQDHEVREALRVSLLDGQLDRAERDGFRAWLAAAPADGQKRALYQSMAFDLAREAIEQQAVNHHSALNWLERVVKLLHPLAPSLPAGSVAEACFSPQHDGASRIARLFDAARQTADVCVFTITDDRISAAMSRAHQRGVKLRVITDDEKQFDPGSDVERLARAGIPVRVDNTEFHMHHKFALFDGTLLLTGSYNWTRSAALHNEENFVLTSEPRLIRSFTELFEQLWRQFDSEH
jgi:mitochondrial cardiolipin hydrolase